MSNAGSTPCRAPLPVARVRHFVTFLFLFLTVVPLAYGADSARAAAAKPPLTESEYATANWSVLDAKASFGLDLATLRNLGFEVAGLRTTGTRTPHPLSVTPASAPTFSSTEAISLEAAIGADGFHGWERGTLQLQGGFRLRGPAGDFDFTSLELRPGARPGSFELVDRTGTPMIGTVYAQWLFDAEKGALRYLNADLEILPALAGHLGDARYAGVIVGVLDIDFQLRTGAIPAAPTPSPDKAIPPCGDWSGTVDVGLVNMSSIAQAGIATINGRSVVVVLPSAELKNLGTANVPWFAKFNTGNATWRDQHPFLVWQMARSKDGVFEPLGRSDLKHAFLTLNTGCSAGACTTSDTLGIGCADVYGTSTNNSVGSLAPRSEVSAFTGIWAHCFGTASHFDTNGDCTQDFSGSGENSFTHGLKAAEADLQVAGATYYVEAFYIVRNDSNIFNSMGYRQVAPAKPASTWSFPTVGAYATGPAINAWVNPTTPGADADNKTLDTGEGRVQLAVRVTPVAGSPGKFRYAYALQNHDFDRRIKSFRVPFPTAGLTLENMVFADGDGFAANNWTAAVDAGGITWTAPAATTPPAELDYASFFAFRFDADQGGSAAQAALGVFEAGAPTELTIQTMAPASGVVPAGAGFYTLAPCRLFDTRTVGGAMSNGQEREVNALTAGCGVPAEAIALAVNVTSAFPSGGGSIAVYTDTASAAAGVVSFNTNSTRANNAIAQLTVDGKLKVSTTFNTGGTSHVLIDVVGYYAPTVNARKK